jgi:starvation-inducible DNA-binding protein
MSTTPAVSANNHATKSSDHTGLLDYRNPKADGLIPVEADKREPVTADAQATVVELLDLYHAAKQSHWNIRGPLFSALHEKLQEYADTYLEYADLLAERILQVGNPADGRPSVVASTANLGEFPGGFLTDKQVLEVMTERITKVGQRVRKRIEHLSKVDEVTSNKLQDLSYELDKQIWQFRVHMQ